jgi:hypothetical protein
MLAKLNAASTSSVFLSSPLFLALRNGFLALKIIELNQALARKLPY